MLSAKFIFASFLVLSMFQFSALAQTGSTQINLRQTRNDESSVIRLRATQPEAQRVASRTPELAPDINADLLGREIRTLESQRWVPVRGEPNQTAGFICPEGVTRARCRNAQAIDHTMPLTLTGRSVTDRDSRITYVEAKFTHDGVEFSGWFDENQTSLQTYRAEVRAQTARVQQEAFETLSEVGLSDEALNLDPSAEARTVRAALVQSLAQSPENFEVAEAASVPTEREYSTNFGPPVCGCTGRECRISSGFGPRNRFRTTNGNWSSGNHRAWDIAGRTGTPVVAVADGRIISAGREGGWGRTIRVDHGNGLIVRYSHLSSYTVTSGRVRRGQEIGKIGTSGNVTGAHLDIAFIRNGTPVNPGNYISDRRSFLNQSCGAI